jgi:transcriptional antiterminator RfaH
MSQTASDKWYLIQCKPRQEVRAAENLRNQSYNCYLPMQQLERLRHGKTIMVCEPLFPGYLFIQLGDLSASWAPVRSTRGVLRLVAFANQAVPVAAGLVERIRDRLIQPAQPEPLFTSGQSVLVTEGLLRDLNAIFTSRDGEERAIILLNLLQREHRLSVPVRALRATA